MGNVLRVWRRDVVRLLKTPAAWLVVIFLSVLPSLYTWFNVAGFWNPYDNTGNLRICVVNEDAGARSDQLGELDLGSRIVSQLASNNQLGWAFMSWDEAEKEVRSGTAFAAFVIPSDFSANVVTLISGDLHQPLIEYYVNEKVGPVAPKITDAGANALDATINEAFVSTVSETLASILHEKLGDAESEAQQAKSNLIEKLVSARDKIGEARTSLDDIAGTARAAKTKVSSARDSLEGARGKIADLSDAIGELGSLTGSANSALVGFSGRASSTLDDVSTRLSELSARTGGAIVQDVNEISGAKGSADAAIASTRATLIEIDQVIGQLEELQRHLPSGIDPAGLQAAIAKARDVSTRVSLELDGLQLLADDLGDAAATIGAASGGLDAAAQETLYSADEFRATLGDSVIPTISAALASITSSAAALGSDVASYDAFVNQAHHALDELDSSFDATASALENTAARLESVQGGLDTLITDLSALAASNALGSLIDTSRIDPDAIAEFMMSPTLLVTEQLYPLEAYGSAMAPLFINLTLWIGVFMLMVIIRLEVDGEGVDNLTISQRFLGRFLLLAPIACVQAAICCAGCVALGVQTADAGLFFVTAIIASLSYLALQYTLSTTLQHVGKGLCVILVFVQIPGATGLYPIEMMPEFFRAAYPVFPFTYGINAIRETISGFYGTQWIACIGMLAGFFAAFMLIGLLVRPYLTNLNRMFAREIGESDLVVGESIELPARRWRMSQIVRALSDRDEYRVELERRMGQFMRMYPRLVGLAAIVGVAVPAVSTPIMMLLGIDKVAILTTWLIWLVLIIAYTVILEFVRDNLSHQISLETMDDEDVRSLFSPTARNALTRVKPLAAAAAEGVANVTDVTRGAAGSAAGAEAGAADDRTTDAVAGSADDKAEDGGRS